MRHILSVFMVISLFNFGYSQNLWKTTAEAFKSTINPSEIAQGVQEGKYIETDYPTLVQYLSDAPTEFTQNKGILTFEIPMPDGKNMTFNVYESKIMEEGLAVKYPNLKSYKIINPENPKINGRIGVGPYGFHGSIRTPKGSVYIDKYSDNDLNKYVTYYTKDYVSTYEAPMLACGTDDITEEAYEEQFAIPTTGGQMIETRGLEGEITLRTYRLALSCTGEWGVNQGGTVESALTQMNIALNRINGVFENEIAVRLILVADNDKLVHLDGSMDPYNNPAMGGSLLQQNTFAISSAIGTDAYDIGHIFTASCSDVGGIAALASVCSLNKGAGVTCHYSPNIEVMAVRVTCHELGHQFAAPHTFNNCNGNESSWGYEPGSGSTIMSYGGLCGSELNVVNIADEYYHGVNIEQMIQFTTKGQGDNCATYIETSNIIPEVSLDYTDGFYIPIETPFRLNGHSTDENDDELTYVWEEFDKGPSSILGSPIGDAPQFRSVKPDVSSERFFPNINSIVNNLTSKNEVLPFYDKDMTFRLTVRDNNPEGGGANWEEVQFFATEEAGPFKVVHPNLKTDLVAGSTVNVEWDVANTDESLVNCQFVDIMLSTDGGYTTSYVLASYAPNDGEHEVVIPNSITNKARVWIQGSGNIFFDIANFNSEILPATEAGFHAVLSPKYQNICLPNNPSVHIDTESFLDYDTPINFEVVSGLPTGATASFSTNPAVPGDDVTLDFDFDNVSESGTYEMEILAVSDMDTVTLQVIMDLTSSDFSDLATVSPVNGASGVVQVPTFEWAEDLDASFYIFELSDNPSFEGGDINIKEEVNTNSLEFPLSLFKNTIYFWRVTAVNSCGKSYTTEINTLATEALSCKEYAQQNVPIHITGSGTPTIEIKTELVTSGVVSDVNVKRFKGGHVNFKHLSAKLISPAGTEVELFKNICPNQTSFNGGFDQDSPVELSCPLKNGIQYTPIGDLSVFNGEALFGTWIFELKDNVSGDGGQVNEFSLDICSNASLSPPYIVHNHTLKAVPGKSNFLNNGTLLIEDDDTDPEDINVTLVEVPLKGVIELNGTVLKVGDKFTMANLNDNSLMYVHDGASLDPDADSFVFVTDDSEGGWIDMTTYDIDLDLVNSITDKELDIKVAIYPNPAQDMVQIRISDTDISSFDIEVYNLLGSQVISRQTIENKQLNTSSLLNGNYFVKIIVDGTSVTKKLQIQR